VKTIARYAPNVPGSIEARQVLTPLDLERTYGLTEGNIFHGDLVLEQLFFMRPVPGWARYRTPVRGLYLCGAGAHPGGGVTGAPGYNARGRSFGTEAKVMRCGAGTDSRLHRVGRASRSLHRVSSAKRRGRVLVLDTTCRARAAVALCARAHALTRPEEGAACEPRHLHWEDYVSRPGSSRRPASSDRAAPGGGSSATSDAAELGAHR
jgi:hypothetical protein